MPTKRKLMFGLLTALLLVLAACSTSPEAVMEQPDTANALEDGTPLGRFVDAAAPEWNFARAVGNNTCFPEPAIFANGKVNSGAEPGVWPNADHECRSDLERFPTYYIAKQCRADEIRTSYTIYQPSSYFFGGGHRHDMEGIYVIWKLRGGKWYRDELVMGRHGDWVSRPWEEAESWNANFTKAGLGLRHPRIFVSWASHAMFNNQKTTFTDIASQLDGNEYRSSKYPVRPINFDSEFSYDMRRVTANNKLGRQFAAAKDHFTSESGLGQMPHDVDRKLCDLPS